MTTRLSLAVLLCAACSSSTSGLKVDIDPANQGALADSMEVVITVTGGFASQAAGTVDNVGYTVEDRNGDDDDELVVRFSGPFPKPFSFHVDTRNQDTLQVEATARAFNHDMDLFAGGAGSGELAPGGKGGVSITLAAQTSPVGGDTRTTDLKTMPADVAITSTETPTLSKVVACDLNGDHHGDIIVGAPNADPGLGIGATGAVYVLMGGSSPRSTIDVDHLGAQDLAIFGVQGGDQLGAAIDCADVDGDGADDLFIGAPKANLAGDDDAGKIYLVRGRTSFAAINLASATSGANIEWRGGPGNNLGRLLAYSALGGSQMLAATPGTMSVHLLPVPPGASQLVIDVAAPDHLRVTGVVPTALGFGDYDHDNNLARLDIAIGDAEYRAPGDGADRRGAVYVFSAPDASIPGARAIGDADVKIPGPAVGSQFGAAVLTFDSGRNDDLLIGAPGVGDGAGTIYLFQNDADFFAVKDRSTTETSVRTLAAPEAGGRFGTALAVSRSGAAGTGTTRLIVGAPTVTRADRERAGAAYAFTPNADRAFRLREQLYGAAANGLLGSAVAGGQVDSEETVGDMLAVAPELANAGGMPRSGAVYVRFGQP